MQTALFVPDRVVAEIEMEIANQKQIELLKQKHYTD